MCGIVAALPMYTGLEGDGPSLDPDRLDALGFGGFRLADLGELVAPRRLGELVSAVAQLRRELENPALFGRLVGDRWAVSRLAQGVDDASRWTATLDDEVATLQGWSVEGIERTQERLRALVDGLWATRHDVIALIDDVPRLAGGDVQPRAAVSYLAILRVLAALDRLEVRGRDSAGLSIWVSLGATGAADVDGRDDLLLRNGAAIPVRDGAVFVYKHAAVVGRLGDNVAALRRSIEADSELHRLVSLPSATVTVLAHTRWASVGRISESNAHPVDSRNATGRSTGPLVLAALNGDIDNYLEVPVASEYEGMARLGVTTDAKVIPLTLTRSIAAHHGDGAAALTDAAQLFRGSMAIAAQVESAPDELLLMVKGSGQGLYVGVADHGFLVASEVYGLVGATDRYLRMDGSAGGDVLILDRHPGGGGIARRGADGSRAMVDDKLRTAEVTTRDLALGENEHYLAKEISEASSSFAKTLRGRIRRGAGGLEAWLSEESFPSSLADQAASGSLREVVVIGQGTAAVAARGVAQLMSTLLPRSVEVRATPATEYSMYGLAETGSGTLVVAISQSGSTTDTNRSVALAKERGASVLAIVNRRDSDLAALSDAIVYTSDGRDVEMSVASTKAFYAQVAAGCLVGLKLGRVLGSVRPENEDRLLRALEEIPAQLTRLNQRSAEIEAIASNVATRYPYWAVVGSGAGLVAAAEIRIKLSELCYKTVSVDAIEDKKHIDLCAEALVVVCAAGTLPRHIPDIIKEVEIYSAHRNRSVVICDEGSETLWPTDSVIAVPRTRPELAWILATAAGHLFAYHAAKAIDLAGAPLREALDALEAAVDHGRMVDLTSNRSIAGNVAEVVERARRGDLRGVLTSDASVSLAMLLSRQLTGVLLGSDVAESRRKDDTEQAREVLSAAIEQLTRSIDTVKHQAKTVTVGTSRSDSGLADNPVVTALDDAGFDVQALTLGNLRALAAFASAVARVNGVTRYSFDGQGVRVVQKTGIAASLTSRAEQGGPLVGSKRLAVESGESCIVRGRSDGRVVIVVPGSSFGDSGVRDVAVVHIDLATSIAADAAIALLEHLGHRWQELRAAVTETLPDFAESSLERIPVEELVFGPIDAVATSITTSRH